jgi:hypothetical protein
MNKVLLLVSWLLGMWQADGVQHCYVSYDQCFIGVYLFFLNWNVHGLNNTARHQVVRDQISYHKCTIVCLHETKLQAIDDPIVSNTIGQQFLNNYTVLPVDRTRGGVILTCSHDHFTMS